MVHFVCVLILLIKKKDRLVATLLVFPVQMQPKKSSEQAGNETHVSFFFYKYEPRGYF